MHIVVVDDSRIARAFVVRILQKLGHSDFFEASNGVEALAHIQGGASVDLILTDWNMPEMDGLSLVKALQSDPGMAQIPVIMVSSESEQDRIVEAIRCGARNYVTKPITPGLLESKIADVHALQKLETQQSAAPAAAASAASLAGNLQDVDLISLTQFINQSQMSGDLKIKADGNEGTVCFRTGDVHDAQWQSTGGDQAFFVMMDLPSGTFEFEVKTDPIDRTIEAPTMSLLMEGLRIKDEKVRLAEEGQAG